MIIICTEGCHGSGKTQLCNRMKSRFNVLDEGFISMPQFSLHPQSLVMESIWVSNWITRLLQKQKECKAKYDHDNFIFFADRSPYSAVFYAKEGGELLEPLIQRQLADLRKHNIFVYTIYLEVDQDLLWSRIQSRLQQEPFRAKYNEGSRAWMEKTVAFYESKRNPDNTQSGQPLWDYVIQNNDIAFDELVDTVLERLEGDVSGFADISSPTKRKQVQHQAPLSVLG